MIVYSYRRCPFAMRVRMTLHEKALPFIVQEEDLKNFSETLRKLHPEAKVPVLVHNERAIYESAVIVEYIEDAFPNTIRLMPEDAYAKAEARLWTHWCNSAFKPDVDRLKYGTSRFTSEECQGIEIKVTQHVQKLEDRLKDNEWLVGKYFSLADINVFPFCRQLRKLNPTPSFLAQFPNFARWTRSIELRPSFIRTMER